jgi:hypothetical protein
MVIILFSCFTIQVILARKTHQVYTQCTRYTHVIFFFIDAEMCFYF